MGDREIIDMFTDLNKIFNVSFFQNHDLVLTFQFWVIIASIELFTFNTSSGVLEAWLTFRVTGKKEEILKYIFHTGSGPDGFEFNMTATTHI